MNRKLILVTLLLALFTSLSTSGQDTIEILVKEIRKECDKVNKDIAKLTVVQKDINDQSAEGGLLKEFKDGKILRKAILTFFGETGQVTSEYYFLNTEVIFVYEKEERYKSPIGLGKTEIDTQEENRYYFQKQKLIRWIGNDGEMIPQEKYAGKESEILDDINRFLK